MSVSKREQIYNKSKNKNKLAVCDLSQRRIRLCRVKKQTKTQSCCQEEHLDMAFASSLHSNLIPGQPCDPQTDKTHGRFREQLGLQKDLWGFDESKRTNPRALIPVQALRSSWLPASLATGIPPTSPILHLGMGEGGSPFAQNQSPSHPSFSTYAGDTLAW